ncbi:hypothetical protein D3C80_1565170 [compost metagenome]
MQELGPAAGFIVGDAVLQKGGEPLRRRFAARHGVAELFVGLGAKTQDYGLQHRLHRGEVAIEGPAGNLGGVADLLGGDPRRAVIHHHVLGRGDDVLDRPGGARIRTALARRRARRCGVCEGRTLDRSLRASPSGANGHTYLAPGVQAGPYPVGTDHANRARLSGRYFDT